MTAHGSFWRFLRSPGFKFVLIGALVFVISIPLALVWVLLSERQSRAGSVQREIAGDWGGAQRILGPFLIVPYTARATVIDAGKQVDVERERYAVILPDTLNAEARADTEIRKRSIYEATVYRSKISLKGRFPVANIAQVDANAITARWRDAVLALAIFDVSGLKSNVLLEMEGGKTVPFEPSVGVGSGPAGIHALPGLSAGESGSVLASSAPFDYTIKLDLNGSSALKFAPVGRDTQVTVTSNWPHPSFTGFLPVSRTIDKDGFSAVWRVPHLARSVPQSWVEGGPNLALDRFSNVDFGVNLFVPVDFYSLVERALKYGFLIIAAVFGGVFITELSSRRRVHPVQYVFVGLALVIFFVLLLSLSEHIGFTKAYLAASTATTLLIFAYAAKAFGSVLRGLIVLGLLAVLYGLIYFVLRLEDYALLAGALLSFALLAAAMFATLKVNWSGDEPEVEAKPS